MVDGEAPRGGTRVRRGRPARVRAATTRVVFAPYPGRSAPGIEGLSVKLNGADPVQTGADGAVELRTPGTQVEVVDPRDPTRVWASFVAMARPGVPPIGTDRGLRARLNMLGYNAGLEDLDGQLRARLVSGRFDPGRHDEPANTRALERAVLQFEADEGLLPMGILSRRRPNTAGETPAGLASETRSRLERAVRLLAGGDPPGGEAAFPGGAGETARAAGVRSVHAHERVVFVRFDRQWPAGMLDGDGEPTDAEHPWLDDRGFRGEPHGPWVSMTGGTTIHVRLVRENLTDDAPLTLTVEGEGLTVDDRGPLRGAVAHQVTLRAPPLTSDWHRRVTVRVRLGDAHGPVVHSLGVWVLRTIRLNACMIEAAVRVGPSTVQRDALDADEVRRLMRNVNVLLRPAGLELHLRHRRQVEYRLGRRGSGQTEEAHGAQELAALKKTLHFADAINIYCVVDLGTFGQPNALALGVAPGERGDEPVPGGMVLSRRAFQELHPGTVVHELGHVLGLLHVDPDGEPFRVSTWALRRMMFWSADPPPMPDWQELNVQRAGARSIAIGTLLSLKDLRSDHDDHEVSRMRQIAGNTQATRGERPYTGAGFRDGVRDDTVRV